MRSMLGFPDVLEEWNLNFQFSCAKLLWIGPHRTTFRKLGPSADHTTLQDSGENFNQVQVPVKQKRCSFKPSQPECFAHSELFAIATKTSNEDTRRAPHAGLLVGPQQLLTTWVMSTGWCRSRQDAIRWQEQLVADLVVTWLFLALLDFHLGIKQPKHLMLLQRKARREVLWWHPKVGLSKGWVQFIYNKYIYSKEV